ncbi:MAG: hypothetical protein GXO75_02645 [Calditrichaeota bacterium]|nr:hypothetical protein [Calditrichota bacterium]
MNNSRDKILGAVKDALQQPSHLPPTPQGIDERIKEGLASVTPKDYVGLREQFKKELELVSGEFQLVHSTDEIVTAISRMMQESNYTSLTIAGDGPYDGLAQRVTEKNKAVQLVKASDYQKTERKEKLAATEAALVDVNLAVADVASLALLYDDTPSSLPHFLPLTIFVVIKPEQLVANLFELFEKLPAEKAKNMTLITGPSRTADVEKVLVLGAHGPKRLVVFMLEEK